MINLLNEYARIAFATESGATNPKRPTLTLEEFERNVNIGSIILEATNRFCWQHLRLERLLNGETTVERLNHEAPESLQPRFLPRFCEIVVRFHKLYNIGVISLSVIVYDTKLLIHMTIWDGTRYRSVDEMLRMILPSDTDSSPGDASF